MVPRLFFKRTRALKTVLLFVLVVLLNLSLLGILNYGGDQTPALTEKLSSPGTGDMHSFEEPAKHSAQHPANKLTPAEYTTGDPRRFEIPHHFTLSRQMATNKYHTYDYDPRLTTAAILRRIATLYSRDGSGASVKLPFSWYDFTDLSSLNSIINLPAEWKPDCDFISVNGFRVTIWADLQSKIAGTYNPQKSSAEKEKEVKRARAMRRVSKFKTHQSEYCRSDSSSLQPGFRIFENMFKSKPNVKAMQAKSYLYSEAPAPLSLVIVTENGNVEVELLENSGVEKQEYNLLNSGILESIIADADPASDTVQLNVWQEFENFKQIVPVKEVERRITHDTYEYHLNSSQFEFDGREILKSEPLTRKERQFHDSLSHSISTPDMYLQKYFQEALLSRSKEKIRGGHFDWRFFSADINTLQRQKVLNRLIRTWLDFSFNAGYISWISHGNLLAYNFNGLNFPWDDDIDVQMPIAELAKLAREFNHSIILENPKQGYGRYLLDINDSLTHRIKGNTNNLIDGRFIDVETGMFIDITGLSVSPTDLPLKYREKYATLIQNPKFDLVEHEDPNYKDGMYDQVSKEDLKKLMKTDPALYKQLKNYGRSKEKTLLTSDKSLAQRYDINHKLEIYNCRNNHFNSLEELSPLRLSYFERVPVYIPNNYTGMIRGEYKAQFKFATNYDDYIYLAQLRIWVSKSAFDEMIKDEEKSANPNLLTEEDVLTLLNHDEILRDFYKTWDSTIIREKEKELEDVPNKYELLSKLIRNKTFTPLYTDYTIDKLLIKDQPVKFDKSPILREMTKEIRLEYQRRVDYNKLGGGDGEIDYNKYGSLYKDELDRIVSSNGSYDPDYELKKIDLEKQITSLKSSNLKKAKEEKLTEFMLKTGHMDKNGKPILKVQDAPVQKPGGLEGLNKQREQKELNRELLEEEINIMNAEA